jgi:hypothetical protein
MDSRDDTLEGFGKQRMSPPSRPGGFFVYWVDNVQFCVHAKNFPRENVALKIRATVDRDRAPGNFEAVLTR